MQGSLRGFNKREREREEERGKRREGKRTEGKTRETSAREQRRLRERRNTMSVERACDERVTRGAGTRRRRETAEPK